MTEKEMVACLARWRPPHTRLGWCCITRPTQKWCCTPAKIGRLHARRAGLIGVKVADGDAAWYAELRAHCQGLAVFVPGHHLATGIANGAREPIPTWPASARRAASAGTNQMLADLPAALALEQRICGFIDAQIMPFRLRDGFSNPALDKLLAAIGRLGRRWHTPALAYRWIEPREAARLRPIAMAMLPRIVLGVQPASPSSRAVRAAWVRLWTFSLL